ncbi:MAG: HAD-IIB family hydrolase [Planctomycetaceae bacterium]|nr:HAD-IIB family hydrolase [Planctomycetaceae bacterium]
MTRGILATDLDGTLIPLDRNAQQVADLQQLGQLLKQHEVTLSYVTGRHLASVQQVRKDERLPAPDWMICDVGTSLYSCQGNSSPILVPEYSEHLAALTTDMPREDLRRLLGSLNGLRLQEAEKQGPFKLSYYAQANDLDHLVPEIEDLLIRESAPYSLIHSVDPFNNDGLLDLLPRGVSKSYALDWWTKFLDTAPEQILFAGDSGNDLAPLTSGFRGILVGNADRRLAAEVAAAHQRAGWTDRLFLATQAASSGVLEGCHAFGLFDATKS